MQKGYADMAGLIRDKMQVEFKAEWELVLLALGIDYHWGQKGELWVSSEEAARAVQEIEDYEDELLQERQKKVIETPDSHDNKKVWPNLLVLSFLLLFYTLTEQDIFSLSIDKWAILGGVDGGKIRAGQWWRVITGLTLHNDPAHVLSNVVFGAPFVVGVCVKWGLGLGWMAIILSGAIGNLLNIFVLGPKHLSIGFSTAVFGAAGILATNFLETKGFSSWFKCIFYGLSLLALLGVGGPEVDLGAHFFGLVSGLFLGTILHKLIFFDPRKKLTEMILFLFVLALVLWAWTMTILIS
jgi:membrane associated rhomboid family serine protease